MSLNKDILILFAPNFRKMGCELAQGYLKKNQNSKIYALCDGQKEVSEEIKQTLGNDLEEIWDLESEEEKWDLDNPIINYKDKLIDKYLGYDYLGKLIVSDRKIGFGFVRGALVRSDKMKDKISKNSIYYPRNYCLNLFYFINKILDLSKPKVVFCYAIASSITLILADLCKIKGITFTTIKSSRIEDYFFIDTNYNARFEVIENKLNKKNKTINENNLTKKIISKFYKSPLMPDYQVKKIEFIKKNSFLIMFLKVMKNFVRYLLSFIFSKNYEFYRLKRSFFEFKITFNKLFIQKKYFKNELPKKQKFIFFTLQVEPEASISIYSPYQSDQIGIIEALAKSAPSDMIIVVKEHIPMLGRRPKDYYKIISKIPRVLLINTYFNSIEILKKSEIVATISGTIAWEALMFKKKVMILGDSPYLCFKNGIVQARFYEDYSKAIKKLIDMQIVKDEEIKKFINCVLDISFKMDSGLIWRGNYDSFSKHERKLCIKNILSSIESILT